MRATCFAGKSHACLRCCSIQSRSLHPASRSRRCCTAALIDSRQRWQHLVNLAADLAFETDTKGRFVFIAPEEVLGWSAGALIGQPSELLLGANDSGGFNPFRSTVEMRGQRVWIKQYNGGTACMAFAVAPLFDAEGHITGSRGIGIDVTEGDTQAATDRRQPASRRGARLHIWCVAQEVMAPRMMDAALSALVNALAAEGATVVAAGNEGRVELLHEVGPRVACDTRYGGSAGQ